MFARRRMRRRRVARAAVGTAVVAGTAGAVRHHQEKRYARQDADEQAEYQAQQEAYEDQQDEPTPEPAPEVDPITQIERLGALKEQGLITEEEFAAQKAKILGT